MSSIAMTGMVMPKFLHKVRDFMNYSVDLGLVDINSRGFHFTWTNNDTWSTIDRAMCNQEWFANGLNAAARFFSWVVSRITLHVCSISLI